MDGPVPAKESDNDSIAEALSLFDTATEKEDHGLMSEAVTYYRQAFKLNPRVDQVYREHRLPNAQAKLAKAHGKNFGRKIDPGKLQAIDVDALLDSFGNDIPHAPNSTNLNQYVDDHVTVKFSNHMVDIYGEFAAQEPVSVLTKFPQEIWIRILVLLLEADPEAWFNFGISCKKHAYYAFNSSQVWERMCYMVYPFQSYDQENQPSGDPAVPIRTDPALFLTRYNVSWKDLLRTKPFIKFLGCYISVVNYYSEGGRAELSTNWNNPVRTSTYYRYLRFYPHGACIMALTRLEPTKVVSQFLKKNILKRLSKSEDSRDIQNFDPADEPHKIFHGKWTIRGDDTVHIEVNNGSVSYYNFHYYFKIRNFRGGPSHSKLTWVNFNAVWKPTPGYEEREGEVVDFNLKNEKDFKFLRVRLYTLDN